jgi:hypothetical protein
MSEILKEVLLANASYSDAFGDKGKLALPPARRFAILTCMDARLDPAKFAGLREGDAHVIRNAGGRASLDAIRSLVISYKLLGTQEWFVIHHTDVEWSFLLAKSSGTYSSKAWKPPQLLKKVGLMWVKARDLPLGVRSTGSNLRTLARRSLTMCAPSAHILWFQNAFRSTAISTT